MIKTGDWDKRSSGGDAQLRKFAVVVHARHLPNKGISHQSEYKRSRRLSSTREACLREPDWSRIGGGGGELRSCPNGLPSSASPGLDWVAANRTGRESCLSSQYLSLNKMTGMFFEGDQADSEAIESSVWAENGGDCYASHEGRRRL